MASGHCIALVINTALNLNQTHLHISWAKDHVVWL